MEKLLYVAWCEDADVAAMGERWASACGADRAFQRLVLYVVDAELGLAQALAGGRLSRPACVVAGWIACLDRRDSLENVLAQDGASGLLVSASGPGGHSSMRQGDVASWTWLRRGPTQTPQGFEALLHEDYAPVFREQLAHTACVRNTVVRALAGSDLWVSAAMQAHWPSAGALAEAAFPTSGRGADADDAGRKLALARTRLVGSEDFVTGAYRVRFTR